ncbi:MAG TPA: hypothetical protein VGE52_15230 [Pirellulales bacterium]
MTPPSPDEAAIRRQGRVVVLLRASAVLLCLAAPAVVMPIEMMQTVHGSLGLGRLAETPLVSYLARSLSAFYAFHGLTLWFLSRDVPRYAPLLEFFGLLGVLAGVGMIALDVVVGMPFLWSLIEGPAIVLVYGSLLFLIRDCRRSA